MNSIKTNKLLEIKPLVDVGIIEETLTRMGIPDNKNKVLYQSCHIIKQFDTYFLCHFKQLFTFSHGKDGFPGYGNVSIEDIERRNSIAFCLLQWKMIEIIEKEEIENHSTRIFVLPYSKKNEWQLIKKFNVKNLMSE